MIINLLSLRVSFHTNNSGSLAKGRVAGSNPKSRFPLQFFNYLHARSFQISLSLIVPRARAPVWALHAAMHAPK